MGRATYMRGGRVMKQVDDRDHVTIGDITADGKISGLPGGL